MKSNDSDAKGLVATALWKGCLGGLGLGVVFLLISGLTYLALSGMRLGHNILLLLTIASGPVLGTSILLAVLLLHSTRRHRRATEIQDETTTRDRT